MNIEQLEITATDLCRLAHISQAKAKATLAKCKPTKTKGRVRLYRLPEAIQALHETHENQRERKERLQADVIEERLRRMRGESLDRSACYAVWGDRLKRLVDCVKGLSDLTHAQKVRICDQLRHDMLRTDTELLECTFDAFNVLDEASENQTEEDHEETD